jgi:hypothetical protein
MKFKAKMPDGEIVESDVPTIFKRYYPKFVPFMIQRPSQNVIYDFIEMVDGSHQWKIRTL